jgi:hypothetical protein
MKRVLYNTSNADPFIKVAQKLQKEHGLEPVYWIGFNYDHSEELVPKAFSGICYQSYTHAWRGIFNDEIQKKASECYIDVDFLNEMSRYELQALKMMDRLDYDRYSFNYMERERHYYNLIKNWLAVFELYNPEIVISSVNPHRVYDYVLYLLCQVKHIPFITLEFSMTTDWTWINDNIYTLGDKFEASYKKYLSNGKLSIDDLPKEIKEEVDRVLKDYSVAIPYYMIEGKKNRKENANTFSMMAFYLKKYNLFGKNGMLTTGKVPSLMRKRRGYSLEEGNLTLWDSIRQHYKRLFYFKSMSKLYASIATKPVPGEKYILCALHYQPEETTSPSGDIFVNQTLCIETILRNTPEEIYVYVKEHSSQFDMLGQTSRIKEHYLDLIKNPRVRLIPVDYDTFELVDGSLAVSTVTGTIGWESVMRRKPVIMFGMSWYERIPGVIRITDSASAERMYDFILNYEFDEQKILAYLMAFKDNAFKCYQYDGMKERMNISEEECVDNIANAIIQYIDEKHITLS